jgi:hypothetical protein
MAKPVVEQVHLEVVLIDPIQQVAFLDPHDFISRNRIYHTTLKSRCVLLCNNFGSLSILRYRS